MRMTITCVLASARAAFAGAQQTEPATAARDAARVEIPVLNLATIMQRS